MEKRVIITIGRQFGSGGRAIGKRVAEELGIAFYDKELINLASKESGISGEFFEKADEQPSTSRYRSFSIGGFSLSSGVFFQSQDYLSGESLFKMQSDVIRKLAAEKSCVLVGRCADYILRGDSDCIRVFISANEHDRVKRIMEYMGVNRSEAKQQMQKADKVRSEYYNYYTDKVWGAATSYDLCMNSSLFSEEQIVDVIKKLCESR